MSYNQPEVIAARIAILETAELMLAGAASPIEGVRTIARLRSDARLVDDLDVMALVAIASDTEALPMGSQREHWQAQALLQLPKIGESQADKLQSQNLT